MLRGMVAPPCALPGPVGSAGMLTPRNIALVRFLSSDKWIGPGDSDQNAQRRFIRKD